MHKFSSLLFLCICLHSGLSAQIFPQEGSRLCWRLIGFSFPPEKNAAKYKIEIATGIYNTESDFEKKITTSIFCKTNKTILEVSSFGAQYTWRYISVAGNNINSKSPLHHFSTKITPDVDPAATRLRVTKSAEKYKDYYTFLDGARVLYDMKGNPIWFLPGTDIKANQDAYPRDLKASSHGTITFLTNGEPYEITYAGKILWYHRGNTPHRVSDHYNNDNFHHEFTHLKNGNYMGLLSDSKFIALPGDEKRIAKNALDSNRYYRKIKYTSIVEYDARGNVVWLWDVANYLKKSDLFAHQTPDAPFDIEDLHENSFFFDEAHKTVYLSLRNVNRIIKIKYPQGNVLNTYGPLYKPGDTKMENDLFCGQHSCRISQKGYLYMYNNNTCGAYPIPKISMFKEPSPGNNNLEKIWEYTCTIDDSSEIESGRPYVFGSGGNVLELPDQSMFVSMSAPYCKVFIVNHDKNILWSAIPEKYDLAKQKWLQPVELYRASFVSRKDLEQLIWNSEK